MSIGGGKGGDDNDARQTTTSEPWSGVQPYLKGGYQDLSTLYKRGAPGYYPGQTVAPMSGYTTGALDAMAQRATAGSPLTRAAQTSAQNTLSGQFLDPNSNPHLRSAMDAATRPVIDNYMKNIAPGLDSTFSAAGRYGSNSMIDARQGAATDLSRAVGDITSNMAYQNYGDERQRQIQAGLYANDLANQDYMDINNLGLAGQGFDQHNQALIDANVDKYNYNANKDFNWISQNLGLLNGAVGGSQTTTQKAASPNLFTSALGGGLAGFGVGGLPGALLGGGLGLLGSIF